MNDPRFLQLHFLTAYPAALLNRDDVGMAKRLPFGGAVRLRVSSQCLKRHWRTAEGPDSLKAVAERHGASLSVRSRRSLEHFVSEPLLAELPPEEAPLVQGLVEAIGDLVLGKSASKESSSDPSGRTSQVTVLGRPELDYLAKVARELLPELRQGLSAGSKKKASPKKVASDLLKKDKDLKKNLQALPVGSGVDAAMFGRMVTSDILARRDAAVHVAHAFTVHEEEVEADYFTAVDDLLSATGEGDDELGSGHIGTSELTSGLYYGYVAVDLPLLVDNLSGNADLAADLLSAFVRTVATVSPGAKLGSTAPHGYAQLLLAEAGSAAPRTLANAFHQPVPLSGKVYEQAVASLQTHLAEFDRVYGREGERALIGLGEPAARLREAAGACAEVSTLSELQDWVHQLVARQAREAA